MIKLFAVDELGNIIKEDQEIRTMDGTKFLFKMVTSRHKIYAKKKDETYYREYHPSIFNLNVEIEEE